MEAKQSETARQLAGRAMAKDRAPYILEAIRNGTDRFQASWCLRNMVRALQIHSFNNTTEEWARYYEARIILMARKYGRMTQSMEKELT